MKRHMFSRVASLSLEQLRLQPRADAAGGALNTPAGQTDLRAAATPATSGAPTRGMRTPGRSVSLKGAGALYLCGAPSPPLLPTLLNQIVLV